MSRVKKISYLSFSSLFLGPLILLLFPLYVNGQDAYSPEARKLLDQAFYYADEVNDYEKSIPFSQLAEINPMPGNSKAPAFGVNATLAKGVSKTIILGQVFHG